VKPSEHGIVTLHDPSGDQIGEAMIVALFPPNLARRITNRVLGKPDELTQREPIRWCEVDGEIPAGVTVSRIKLTLPDHGVLEYPVSM
jgi:hypothetical protein